ncbi:potassium transporter TrkA [Clostridium perfringens]|uniref:TrkA domain protein n=1 Tax=Clostridium perfringens TaxID=1502 RepID=A0A140GRU1_CLOPF|nr:TrkA C-terminal domain-containing protein [Clostridium perfringens]AMN31250.1 TrkA domain protein [Clostridium perfringens]TBX14252.1 potassium transporter TrkA [Clostridium perfringens]
MIIIFTFIVFLTLFLVLIEFFTILFKLTGLPQDKARFQVISLLTSTGFTTKESEIIVQHPTRRKLASWLMVFSYVSTATFISFIVNIIMNSLINPHTLLMIFIFIALVYTIKRFNILETLEVKLESNISNSKFWNNINDKYSGLIFRSKGYGLYEIYISNKSVLIGKSILDSNLKENEIQVLNIDKGDKVINFPTPQYIFEYKDKITVYGNIKKINNLLRD